MNPGVAYVEVLVVQFVDMRKDAKGGGIGSIGLHQGEGAPRGVTRDGEDIDLFADHDGLAVALEQDIGLDGLRGLADDKAAAVRLASAGVWGRCH
jgi:hypothetical protein